MRTRHQNLYCARNRILSHGINQSYNRIRVIAFKSWSVKKPEAFFLHSIFSCVFILRAYLFCVRIKLSGDSRDAYRFF